MENIGLEKLINQIRTLLPAVPVPEEPPLSFEQQVICDFLNSRAIRYLVYPFEKSQIDIVKKNGILPNHLESVSQKSKKQSQNSPQGILLYISRASDDANRGFASPAWAVMDAKCLYRDAPSYAYYDRSPYASSAQVGTDLAALERLFAPEIEYIFHDEHFRYERKGNRLISYETTDPTACIVTQKAIKADSILFFWDPIDDCFVDDMTCTSTD